RSHSPSGQLAGLLHPSGEMSFVSWSSSWMSRQRTSFCLAYYFSPSTLPLARRRIASFGGLNPGEIPPALRGCQRFEVAQGNRVIPQRCLDVLGKLCGDRKPRWPRTVAAVSREAFDPWRLQSPAGFELGVAFPIDSRPSAVRSSRRELSCEPPVIQPL